MAGSRWGCHQRFLVRRVVLGPRLAPRLHRHAGIQRDDQGEPHDVVLVSTSPWPMAGTGVKVPGEPVALEVRLGQRRTALEREVARARFPREDPEDEGESLILLQDPEG